MKLKGKVYIFLIQPLLFSTVSVLIIVGCHYLFMLFDYGQSFANELFVKGIKFGWDVILSLWGGLYIVLVILNLIRWKYHKRKPM